MAKRLTTRYPQVFGPYSHRLETGGSTLNGLSLKVEGEELLKAPVARGRMKATGKIFSEAVRFLDENPGGMFAVIETPSGGRIPFLYLKEPPPAR